MRIAGGTLKGRTVASLPGSTTRPTTSALRESLFAALDNVVSWHGKIVIDAFCGSGILGFEALSRGAELVTFIDNDREVCANVRATATDLSVGSKCVIVCTDAIPFLRTSKSPVADVIFSDAPYHMAVGTTLLSLLEQGSLIRAGSIVVLDHSPNEYVVVSDSWRHGYHAHRGGSAIDVYVHQRVQNLHGEASS